MWASSDSTMDAVILGALWDQCHGVRQTAAKIHGSLDKHALVSHCQQVEPDVETFA